MIRLFGKPSRSSCRFLGRKWRTLLPFWEHQGMASREAPNRNRRILPNLSNFHGRLARLFPDSQVFSQLDRQKSPVFPMRNKGSTPAKLLFPENFQVSTPV